MKDHKTNTWLTTLAVSALTYAFFEIRRLRKEQLVRQAAGESRYERQRVWQKRS